MFKLRRLIIIGILVFTVVSACSRSGNSPIPANSGLIENCRVIQHEMGETCVSQDPQRIVTVHFTILANALALGVKPIGSTSAYGDEDLATGYLSTDNYLGNRIGGINKVGTPYQQGIEKILLLKPDLILVQERNARLYPQLAQVAPTVVIPYNWANYWQTFDFVAEVLGKQSTARQVKEDYYRRVKEVKSALDKSDRKREISVVGTYDANNIHAYAQNSFPSVVLKDLKLKRPAAQDTVTSNGVISNISHEKLEIIDGDVMFFLDYNEGDRATLSELQQNPLWQKLKAVQSGQVFVVDGNAWIGANPLAAHFVLDDIEKYLLGNS